VKRRENRICKEMGPYLDTGLLVNAESHGAIDSLSEWILHIVFSYFLEVVRVLGFLG